MQSIFEDGRYRNEPIQSDPCGTGRIFLAAQLRSIDGIPPQARIKDLDERKNRILRPRTIDAATPQGVWFLGK